MMSNVDKIADVSFTNAKRSLINKNYGRAFANFLLFLKLAPERRNEVREDFSLAMREWAERLEREGRIGDLFKCYDQACELFPDNETVLNNIGAQLFRLGYVEEAAAYIRKSIVINPEYLAARENLENICSQLVEQWHFRMLNDTVRNTGFRKAISNAIECGYDTVLDIGTGSGILSLFAVHAGANAVYACEQSTVMYEVAQDVLKANGSADKVCLLKKSSTKLKIPKDIPHRVSLLVTEIFDAGLFGEHVVSTLLHAIEKLLLGQGEINGDVQGRIIPASATVYVLGIECDDVRSKNKFLYPGLRSLDLTGIQIVCSTGSIPEDPYTTENLGCLKGGYKKLTDIVMLLQVNFCNLQELRRLDSGMDLVADFTVKHQGRLDCIALWFDLHLDDNVTISTSPDCENCWDQAIYPVLPCHITSDSSVKGVDGVVLEMENTLKVKFHFSHDCLRLLECETKATCVNNVTPDQPVLTAFDVPWSKSNQLCGKVVNHYSSRDISISSRQDKTEDSLKEEYCHIDSYITNNDVTEAMILSSSSEQDVSAPNSEMCTSGKQTLVHVADREDLCYLNDIFINSHMCQILEKFTKEKNKRLSLLYKCNQLSFLGIQALKIGYQSVIMVTSECHHEIIRKAAEKNEISTCNLELMDPVGIHRLSCKADLILCDLVEPCGTLRQQVLEDLSLIRVTCSSADCKVIPGEVRVHGVFIQSEELKSLSCVVSDESTMGLKIAKFMNYFQLQTHVDIDLDILPHARLSEPFQMFSLDFNETLQAEELPSYLNQTKEVTVNILDTGSITALVYWFEFRLDENLRISTLDSRTHWRQAALMIKGNNCVDQGQDMKCKFILQNSCFDVKLCSLDDY
ncbi:hypothetical protein CHS0354_026258 [Potamilus streckersoni]|uniref:Protein arginine N-methyltransferase domain-containing protein n=1 Tax=Potamilus streckersoni TaxID=2493646 RepID=A0AAE0T6C3_9BIVA|nr:hypothetical protein CHS0354_026258 [Potamilus streckersoni]